MSTPSPARMLPLVGIVMGSDSDWPVMEAAAAALSEFGIPFEADVVSAHRMPTEMIAYGRDAAARGIRVIIAGAGGAAHLPGMLASVTTLPVIGVPVPLKTLDGMDSLLSIVQMPAGVPVATVSIGGARNAGLLAVRILAAGQDALAAELAVKLADFAADLNRVASAKGAALREKAGHNYPLAVLPVDGPTTPRDPMGDRASDVPTGPVGGPTTPRDPMGDRASDVASGGAGE